jgi:RNA polymerase sigma factor (sigma-70 family)
MPSGWHNKVLARLQQAGEGPTDGQLLARFVASRDEASFATLVRRHGPMVLGVCRRLLGDFHEAEDAFQATFLVLARKAAAIVKRESVGCWLYGVADRTAREASVRSARRRARERPMHELPQPAVAPAEVQDWRPLLDGELNRLPEKYRAAIVLCDLEGSPRREAARLLQLPEGTLSSRLTTGRKLLAKRLARCGVTLSGGALAAAVAPGAAAAGVPVALVRSTAEAAVLVAAGQLAGFATPAVVLMKEVMKAMLLKKLRLVVGVGMVLVAFGAAGIAYRAGDNFGAAYAAEKPRNELEALRRENELLKLNLEVVLEKVRAQETELRALRPRPAGGGTGLGSSSGTGSSPGSSSLFGNRPGSLTGSSSSSGGVNSSSSGNASSGGLFGSSQGGNRGAVWGSNIVPPQPDPLKEAEAALKQLREARDKEGQRRAAQALEKAMAKLREQLK